MKNTRILRLITLLMMVSLILSACSTITGAQPTEKEIVFDPQPAETEVIGTPIPTPTLRPTATPTITPEIIPPTPTLDPYSALLEEGRILREQEKFDDAMAKLNQAIQMNQSDPRGYIERGILYSYMDQQDQAITDFNFAINFDPNSANAYNARGNAYSIMGQMEQALVDYTKAIELDPTMGKAYSNRGYVLIVRERVDEALADFNKFVEIDPNNSEAYFNRGQAYLTAMQILQNTDYVDLCIADFNQVLAFEPENAASFFMRGVCNYMKQDLEAAYADLTRSIELDPNEVKAFMLRASLFPNIGTKAGALADLQHVLEISKDPEIIAEAQKAILEVTNTPEATPTP